MSYLNFVLCTQISHFLVGTSGHSGFKKPQTIRFHRVNTRCSGFPKLKPINQLYDLDITKYKCLQTVHFMFTYSKSMPFATLLSQRNC